MTSELIGTIQSCLLFAVIWAEMVLLAILVSHYFLLRFPSAWILILLILISVPAIFCLSGMAFGVILGWIDMIEKHDPANQPRVDFFYIFVLFGEGVWFLIKVLFGAVTSVLIWLITLVAIRIRTPAKGSPT